MVVCFVRVAKVLGFVLVCYGDCGARANGRQWLDEPELEMPRVGVKGGKWLEAAVNNWITGDG